MRREVLMRPMPRDSLAGLAKRSLPRARDVTQAADLLAESGDLAVQSAIVSAMSAADLDRGMELASVAGQLGAASDMMGTLGMPVLAAFLDAKGEQ